MPRRKVSPISPPRNTSSDETVLRALYRRNPARVLPGPLWQTIAMLPRLECRFLGDAEAPAGVELREPGRSLVYGTPGRDALKAASVKLDGVPVVQIHDDFVEPLLRWFDRRDTFFRLVRTDHELPLRAPVPGYVIREIDTTTELPLVATFLQTCSAMPVPGMPELISRTIRPVFEPRLWLWAVDKTTRRPIGMAIADADSFSSEGSLVWIQVLPDVRGMGIGTMLVQELLCRLDQEVAFVTATGATGNPCEPERLLRRCGFTGRDIWWTLRRRL